MDIESLNQLAAHWDDLSDEDKRLVLKELDAIEQELLEWQPLPGPQTMAYYNEADILFYGGAGGAGKTDLILGLAHTAHQKTIIFRREYTQLKGIIERGIELFDNRHLGKFNAVRSLWRIKYKNKVRLIELGACKNIGDEQKFQGIPHDLKAFDEITHYHEAQFRFLCGWLRSVDTQQRKRIVCAGNPPTNSDGDWVIKYWAPWLDDQHPKPAVPGELRWFTTIDGEDVELPTGDEFEHKGELIKPKSRTFIPGRVDDNPYLIEAGYKAQLQSLPEPLRSKMLYGDFKAGREDDAWQVVPTEWVLQAQKRWREMSKPDVALSGIGVDIARGGRDCTVITKRYGYWFDKQISHPGQVTPDGNAVAALVFKEYKDDPYVVFDVIGVGASAYDSFKQHITDIQRRLKVIGFHAAEKSEATDRTKQLTFYNQRAEWYWKFREALDPDSGLNIALPDDRDLRTDLCAPRWKLTMRGIQIESKDDIIERIGRSPDKGDSCVYSFVVQTKRPPQAAQVNFIRR